MNWLQTVDMDLQAVNRRWSDAVRLAVNRDRWGALTASYVARRWSKSTYVIPNRCL